jgi:hypothetical protein
MFGQALDRRDNGFRESIAAQVFDRPVTSFHHIVQQGDDLLVLEFTAHHDTKGMEYERLSITVFLATVRVACDL